jgi:hypothetical protein
MLAGICWLVRRLTTVLTATAVATAALQGGG